MRLYVVAVPIAVVGISTLAALMSLQRSARTVSDLPIRFDPPGVSLVAEDTPHVPAPAELLSAPREVDVATLRTLIASAEKGHDTSVFIGGPVWSVDGTVKPKPGAYLIDDGGIITVRE